MPLPTLSFEVYPPKSVRGSFTLFETISRLQRFGPEFWSVTYGAQGSEQERTLDSALAVMSHANQPVAAHLTASRASKAHILERAKGFANQGISKIVALRGDGDQNSENFAKHQDGFANSIELVSALSKQGFSEIYVGAYPDGHPSSTSQQQNIDFLKAKFDAGAHAAITQFFFEADSFLRFRDACSAAGINNEIIPGILPIHNWQNTVRFAKKCGVTPPDWMMAAYKKSQRDDRSQLLSLAIATETCSRLIEHGVNHLHFYTLNTADLTEQILTALGCKTQNLELKNVA